MLLNSQSLKLNSIKLLKCQQYKMWQYNNIFCIFIFYIVVFHSDILYKVVKSYSHFFVKHITASMSIDVKYSNNETLLNCEQAS